MGGSFFVIILVLGVGCGGEGNIVYLEYVFTLVFISEVF